MYSGTEQEVKIRIDKSLLDTVFDVFGVDTHFIKIDDTMYEFTAVVQLSPQFYGWCCSFGNKLKVVAPSMVVEELKTYIESVSGQYK